MTLLFVQAFSTYRGGRKSAVGTRKYLCVCKSQEKHEDDENCFKDETKFKNNINSVTCEAKLMETFPSIVLNIAATSPYNVLPLAFRSRLTRN